MPQVWLITGSSRGLGRAFAEAVLEADHRVVAAARNPDPLNDLRSRFGDNIRTVPLDVTSESQAKDAVDVAVAGFGHLDVLVNNAGYGNVGSVEDTSLDEFRAQIETNLFGVIIMTKAVLSHFRERGAGHITQVTSISGRIGPIGRAPYAAAKFGVEGFSESLSKEVKPLGIKVSIGEPGAFEPTLRVPQPTFVKADRNMTPRLERVSGSRGTTTESSRGDPAKAAGVLLHIASMPDPPLRLLHGSDSYSAAEKSALAQGEFDGQWRALSVSTDF